MKKNIIILALILILLWMGYLHYVGILSWNPGELNNIIIHGECNAYPPTFACKIWQLFSK